MPFLLRRLLGLVATVFGISLVIFAVMNVLPGDPALSMLGIDSTLDARTALREQLGLNAPVWQRYLLWLGGLLRGDFGTSYAFRVPVSELIVERIPLTLAIAVLATVLTVTLALLLGLFAAAHHNKPADWITMLISQLGIAIPAFWLALLLVLVFAVNLRWLPPGGFPGWSDPVAALRALVLPTISLALVQSAVLTRVTRAAVLEVMRLDYVRTARALGVPHWRILFFHVLPNALIPIVTIAGIQLANLVTGTIVIEQVFFLPGLGGLLFQSIGNRDLFTVQALVMLFALIVVVTSFVVDLLYTLIDPRLRKSGA